MPASAAANPQLISISCCSSGRSVSRVLIAAKRSLTRTSTAMYGRLPGFHFRVVADEESVVRVVVVVETIDDGPAPDRPHLRVDDVQHPDNAARPIPLGIRVRTQVTTRVTDQHRAVNIPDRLEPQVVVHTTVTEQDVRAAPGRRVDVALHRCPFRVGLIKL